MKKSDCAGCYQDFYNYRTGFDGATTCWSFDEKKKLEKRYVVSVEQRPPFGKHDIRKVPPCYSPQRYACVPVDSITKDGYWK